MSSTTLPQGTILYIRLFCTFWTELKRRKTQDFAIQIWTKLNQICPKSTKNDKIWIDFCKNA